MVECYPKYKEYKAAGWTYGSSFTDVTQAKISRDAHVRDGKDSVYWKCQENGKDYWYVFYRDKEAPVVPPTPIYPVLPFPMYDGIVRDMDTFARLEGVKVTVGPETKYTDKYGFFQIRVPSEVSIAMILEKSGYATVTMALTTPKTGTIHTVPKLAAISIPIVKVTGDVVDSVTGEPLEMAEITNGILTALSMADGSYEIEVAPLADVTLTCSKAGYESKTTTLTTPATGTKRASFALVDLTPPEPEPEPVPEPELTLWDKIKALAETILKRISDATSGMLNTVFAAVMGREATVEDAEWINTNADALWPFFNLVSKSIYGKDMATGEDADYEDITREDAIGAAVTIAMMIVGAGMLKNVGKLLAAKGRTQTVSTVGKITAQAEAAEVAAVGKTAANVKIGTSFIAKAALAVFAVSTLVNIAQLYFVRRFWETELPQLALMQEFARFQIPDTLSFQLAKFENAIKTHGYTIRDYIEVENKTAALKVLSDYKTTLDEYKDYVENGTFEDKSVKGILEEFENYEPTKSLYDALEESYNLLIMKATDLPDVPTVDRVDFFITVTPLPDKVLVNGEELEYDSYKFIGTFDPGTFTIRIEKEGYTPIDDETTLGAGDEFTKSYRMVILPTKPLVEVVTVPGYVDVYVADKLMGTTNALGNITFTHEPGPYQMKFHRDGWDDKTIPVTLVSGEPESVNVRLDETVVPPTTGVLTVDSDPPMVEIWIGGEKIGTTDATGLFKTEMAPFSGDVTFTKEGYEDRIKSASLWAGRTLPLKPVLTKKPVEQWLWKLDISATDAEGRILNPKILINDSFDNKWAPDSVLLLPGTYVIRLEKAGYEPWEETITLEE